MLNIDFSTSQSTPKYRQIIDVVLGQLKSGTLNKGDKLPSCNELCKHYGLSQDTVYMAYNELKSLGLVSSQQGKGYFIANTNANLQHKVFVLFDHLTAYKEDLYEAFKLAMKGKGSEQIFFHHNNPDIFKSLIEDAIGEYTEFVIMPIADKSAMEFLDKLAKNRVFILDRATTDLKKKYPYVCQEFERDIYQILNLHSSIIKKYSRIILSIHHIRGHFKSIIKGFREICKKYDLDNQVVFDINTMELRKGDLVIVVDDRDLVTIVKNAQENNMIIGTEVGIISYNETQLKRVIANGITTISTDFDAMGRTMAEMIVMNKKWKIHNPFIINKRNSI